MKLLLSAMLALSSAACDSPLFSATCNEDGFNIDVNSACLASDYGLYETTDFFVGGTTATTKSTDADCLFTTTSKTVAFDKCGTVTDSESATDKFFYNTKVQAIDVESGSVIVRFPQLSIGISCEVSNEVESTAGSTAVVGEPVTITDLDETVDLSKHFSLEVQDENGKTVDANNDPIVFNLGDTAMIVLIDKFPDTDAIIYGELGECWATKVSDSSATDPRLAISDASGDVEGDVSSWITKIAAPGGKSAFQFKMFHFLDSSTNFFHCKVMVTPNKPSSGTARRRRREINDGNVISSAGVKVVDKRSNSAPQTCAALGLAFLAFGALY